MPIKKLSADDVELPRFDPGDAVDGEIFDLSSHKRAREALAFGLDVADPRFNIFVLGEERSGRLTSTIAFITNEMSARAAPDDWVYLYNFRHPSEPRPYRLPKGVGRNFQDRAAHLVRQLRDVLSEAIGGEALQNQLLADGTRAHDDINRQMEALRVEARATGVDIVQTPQGPMIMALDDSGEIVPPDASTPAQRERIAATSLALTERVNALARHTARLRADLQEHAVELARAAAANAIAPLLDDFAEEFGRYHGLSRWIVELRNDVIDNYADLLESEDSGSGKPEVAAERRYSVNLLVDNSDQPHAPVVLEANPTYENLFGRIEYHQAERALDTDFTMIQAGSLHRANGGVLVLRANAVAAREDVWSFLKGALRDEEIRIEELYRSGGLPVAGAPKPLPVPLALKVVMVANPYWYYSFYSVDPEFESYFKIKADIDSDMDANGANTKRYGGLIRRMAASRSGGNIDDDAVTYLLGLASRWASDREKLSSQFERIEDVVVEACRLATSASGISRKDIVAALESRRHRNSRIEDRFQESIAAGTVMIATTGKAVGQINALTVRDTGDHSFGSPSRVTARASAGRRGLVNIERDVELGGPIQQKGVMVLQGFLSGLFARRFPLSFNCSITFEQNYGGVEGDSASLAEVLAILSDLSGLPLRQDLAITGSVNQHGIAQAIGGAHYKIEGFFRTCQKRGRLTGKQGVVVPRANERNLVLRDEVTEAVRRGKFHIYSIETVDEAVELFTGVPAGRPNTQGHYPKGTVYARVAAQLETFDMALSERPGISS